MVAAKTQEFDYLQCGRDRSKNSQDLLATRLDFWIAKAEQNQQYNHSQRNFGFTHDVSQEVFK